MLSSPAGSVMKCLHLSRGNWRILGSGWRWFSIIPCADFLFYFQNPDLISQFQWSIPLPWFLRLNLNVIDCITLSTSKPGKLHSYTICLRKHNLVQVFWGQNFLMLPPFQIFSGYLHPVFFFLPWPSYSPGHHGPLISSPRDQPLQVSLSGS